MLNPTITLVGKDSMEDITPVKPFPHQGDTIAIAHQIKRNNAGDPVGMNKLDRAEPTVINAVYMDGTVRTGTSDIWEVKLAGDMPGARGCKWVTVNPHRDR